jgi:pimeloyl-ACP methyl ester carboxylesterase
MRAIYLHGLPGGPEEMALAGVNLPCPDRTKGEAAVLAALSRMRDAPLHLIGFSLGAALALRLAPHLPVAKLTLISPAGPLELGNFLPDMAGAPVFRAARRPLLFRALTAIQALAFKHAPARSLETLFHSAPAADKALLTAANQKLLLSAIRASLGPRRAGYLAEISRYVQPWAAVLPQITAPVTIWQGEADTWSPPAMAKALAAALPHADLRLLPGQGHYSTLCHALPLAKHT